MAWESHLHPDSSDYDRITAKVPFHFDYSVRLFSEKQEGQKTVRVSSPVVGAESPLWIRSQNQTLEQKLT